MDGERKKSRQSDRGKEKKEKKKETWKNERSRLNKDKRKIFFIFIFISLMQMIFKVIFLRGSSTYLRGERGQRIALGNQRYRMRRLSSKIFKEKSKRKKSFGSKSNKEQINLKGKPAK